MVRIIETKVILFSISYTKSEKKSPHNSILRSFWKMKFNSNPPSLNKKRAMRFMVRQKSA